MARRGVSDTYGAGLEALDDWVERLLSLPEMVGAAAPVIGDALLGMIQATAAAGTSPDGQAWAPRKKDGGRAMAGAASALSVVVVDNVILIKLTGPEVFHHFGAGRKPARHVIPTGGMPDRLGNAIRKGLVDMGVEWMTRGGSHKGSGGKKMRPGMKA